MSDPTSHPTGLGRNAEISTLRSRLMDLLAHSTLSKDELINIREDGLTLRKRIADNSRDAEWLDIALPSLLASLGIEVDKARPVWATIKVFKGGLPGSIPYFFGRKDEMEVLNKWAANTNQRILQIHGAGGYGKTQLVNRWLQDILSEGDKETQRFPVVFCWCFYSLTARIPIAFNEFLTSAIRFFEEVTGQHKQVSYRERPQWLAQLIASGPYLVVLDGLEALQKRPNATYAEEDDGDMELRPGEFRRRFIDMKRFLSSFNTSGGRGKVLLTTRQLLEDLDGPPVETSLLKGLEPDSAVQLLESLEVVGPKVILKLVANYYACHPLSLTLFAFATTWQHGGSVTAWRQVDLAEGRLSEGEIDEKIIESYVKWLRSSPELQFLRLVGFFSEREVLLEDLKVLLLCPDLRVLNDVLVESVRADDAEAELNYKKLNEILALLQRNGLLLYTPPSTDTREPARIVYDAHPLLRNYFRQELKGLEDGRYWQIGQKALFKHYSDKVSGPAEDPEKACILYDAIGFGCEAGLFREAFEVYWERIHHNENTYVNPNWNGHRLGLYSEDLSALGWFFVQLWQKLQPWGKKPLDSVQENLIRYGVAECLIRLGYTNEAGHPISAARMYFENKEHFLIYAANAAGWECERKLIQGEFLLALTAGRSAVALAERSGDSRQILSKFGRLADVALQMGEWGEADVKFREVVERHLKWLRSQELSTDKPIGGFTGFLYGEFLLTRAEIVLAKWDPEGQYLASLSTEQAKSDIEYVINNANELMKPTSNQAFPPSEADKVLHEYLNLRALGIKNILLNDRPNLDIQDKLDRLLRVLQLKFDKFARSESPRLLVKRSKVIRRLWGLNYSELADRSPLLEAYQCLESARDVAKYGEMSLYEADIDLEMAKLLFCEYEHPGRDSQDRQELLEDARGYLASAKKRIDDLRYKKRLPELMAFTRQLQANSAKG